MVIRSGAVGFQTDHGARWIASPDPSHAYGGDLSAYSHDSNLFASSHNGQVGLWMEYLRGRTLAETVGAEGALPARKVALDGGVAVPAVDAETGHVVLVGLSILSLTGLAGEYLWPDNAWWNDKAPLVLPSASFGWASASYRGHSDSGGNIRCSQSSPGSHCVPGAISRGPISGTVSTAVRLKASEVRVWESYVAAGEGKSLCHGWCIAPPNGTSKPISTIS